MGSNNAEGFMGERAYRFWEDKYFISSRDLDTRRNAKISSLVSFIAESAELHAMSLRQVHKEHSDNKKISRLFLSIQRYPAWAEEITLRTGSKVLLGDFECRDFELLDSSGKVILRAMSAWEDKEKSKIIEKICKRSEKASVIKRIDFKNLEEDLDPGKEYLNWVMDLISEKIDDGVLISELELSFLNFVQSLDEIEFLEKTVGNELILEAFIPGMNEAAFSSKIRFMN